MILNFTLAFLDAYWECKMTAEERIAQLEKAVKHLINILMNSKLCRPYGGWMIATRVEEELQKVYRELGGF